MNKNERYVSDIAAPRANAGVIHIIFFCSCCYDLLLFGSRSRHAVPSAAAPIGVQNVIDGIVFVHKRQCGRIQKPFLRRLLHKCRAAAPAHQDRLLSKVLSKLVQVLHHEKGDRQADGQNEWNAAVQQATACRSGFHSGVRFWLKLWLLERILVQEKQSMRTPSRIIVQW